jgi:hypothetical protein
VYPSTSVNFPAFIKINVLFMKNIELSMWIKKSARTANRFQSDHQCPLTLAVLATLILLHIVLQCYPSMIRRNQC